MSDKTLNTLSKIPLFHGLNQDELKVILDICKPIQTKNREYIFHEGDASHDLFILLAGEVDLTTKKHGPLISLGTCDVFGEIGLITQRPRSASACSKQACSLLKIHHIEFNLLTGKHPRISSILMRNISTTLANHVIRMNNAPLEHIPKDTPNAILKNKQVLSSTP